MSNRAEDILAFWLSCVREQDIQKTELGGKINSHQFISLDDQNNIVSNQRDSVNIKVSKELSSILKSNKKSLLLRNNDSRPVFFFPLIEIKGKISPLFFVDLTDFERTIISGDKSQEFNINPWSVDTKIGVVTDTFVKMGYDEDAINLDDSIINFIEFLTGEFNLNFKLALDSLLAFITSDLERQSIKVKVFNKGVLKYSDFSDATLIFKKDILSYIENKVLLDRKIINDFLFRTETNKKDVEQFFLGSFQETPLSHGQAQSLSELRKSEDIVSVQGPPGTGKTTMITSAIADQITERAISIAEGRQVDFKPILITSYTNKAVENVIERLEESFPDELAWSINLNVGNKEKRRDATKKIERAIANLQGSNVNIAQYNKIKTKLLEARNSLTSSTQRISNELTESELSRCALLSKNTQIKTLNDLIEEVSLLFGVTPNYSNTINATKSHVTSLLNKRKRIKLQIQTVKNKYNQFMEIIQRLKLESLKDKLLEDDFYNYDLISNYHDKEHNLESSIGSWINFLITLFAKKDNRVAHEKIDSHTRFLNELKLHDLPKLVELRNEARKLKAQLVNINNELNGYTSLLDIFLKKRKVAAADEEFRVRNSKRTYLLFKLSIEFLILSAKLNKNTIVPALETWSSHIDPDKTYAKIENTEEFLNNIGLIFPVITSTLSSLGNVLHVNDNYFISGRMFSLSICDESGMSPIFCMPTLLLRSDKVCVVGDQKQLEPIINIDQNRIMEFYKKHNIDDKHSIYHPLKSSAFQRSAFCLSSSFKETGNSIILNEHRRCLPEISDLFIEIAGYDGLINKTKASKIKETLFSQIYAHPITFIDCKPDLTKTRNVSYSEISAIKKMLLEMKENGIDIEAQVGIITPYQNQSICLQSELRNLVGHRFNNKKIGTVHAFQGTEFDIVILSMVVSNEQFNHNFINAKPNLINVAASRARYRLIVVGNYDYLCNIKGNIAKLINRSHIA
jgi:archaellum component FlaC